jgi:predicted ATPase/DNA-binding winged helix-turn-helix (wHTH) protein
MADPTPSYAFGPYHLLPAHRALLADGQEVALRGRAFDLLLALVERRDRVVTKEELLELVWPGRVVEEGNLTVHVAGLRKLLGQGVIATLSGRGYRFVAPVSETPGAPQAPVPEAASPPAAPPAPLTRLIGRQDDLEGLAARLQEARLVTVVGAGGVGKTRLALAAAERLRDRFPDGIWLADLGAQDDPALVPKTIALALGLDVRGAAFQESTRLWLAPRRGLLLLDGCEHLLQAVAQAAEALLRACSGVTILATSREPLRAEGEALHRLQPLGVADTEEEVTAAHLRDHAASALFLDRARAVIAGFAPDDGEAAEIMAICRRLDGVPLAIELAAPMLQALSPAQLRAKLDQRLGLLAPGRRTALPRQQTLQATIAWSLELLKAAELDLLQRLSVFTASWTVEAAAFVAEGRLGEDETFRLIAQLVEKSLLQADLAGAEPRYRMLDATRFYAGERLSAPEAAATRARSAEWLARICGAAEADWPFLPDADWAERYGAERENLRAGLAWALGEASDPALGVTLASVSGEVLGELHATGELMAWFDRALAKLTEATPSAVAGRLWLGRSGWLAAGEPEALPAAERAVALFRMAGGGFDLGRALWHQALQHATIGETDAADPLLAEAEALLGDRPDSKALVSLRRVQALAETRRGRFDRARPILDAAIAMAQRLGARRDAALVAGDIAELLFATGRTEEAIAMAKATLAALGPVKSRSAWVQHIHGALASYLLAKGEMAEASRLAGDRLYAARIMGIPKEVLANLERAGLIAALEGDAAAAGRLLGHSEARQAARAAPRSHASETVVARLRETLRDRLEPDALRRLAAEGAQLSEEQAISEAARAML